jgi:hypothetical protein
MKTAIILPTTIIVNYAAMNAKDHHVGIREYKAIPM